MLKKKKEEKNQIQTEELLTKDPKKPQKSKSSKKSKGKKSKNREILFACYLFVFLFLSMMGYICYFVYNNQETLINNSYNAGQQMLVLQNRRGSIYSADGKVLAETLTGSDGSETRSYPYSNTFSHVVGYATKGRTGIEALANYYLINSNAPLNLKVDNSMENAKNPGDSVYTTLNADIQQAAYDALGVYDGAVIATDPKTGKVLAMVSKPDFDPNEIASVWENLVEDKESSVLLNRVTQGLYPPGSTFKILTALEYIRENPTTYTNYRFTCTGSITINGSKIRCYHGSNHGKIDFTTSFAKSCNSSFANLASKLDWALFADTLDRMYFDEKLPFDMDTSISRIYAEKDMATEDQMQTAIGQGATLVTPLHLNMITAAIANDGVLQYPYILERVENVKGVSVKSFTSGGTKKLMSAQESYILSGLMKDVVEEGTATKLLDRGYTAAGKTGSAEYNSASDSHAWFTGFAPADDPEICVTVIIEGAGSGGDYAVPVARRVFDAYFGE